METIVIFTDGSTLNNQVKGNRKGGAGVFFGDNDKRNLSISLVETDNFKVTNQVAELTACIEGIEKIISSEDCSKKTIIIYTDSMYIVSMINSWAINWEKNGWKKSDGNLVQNIDLVKKLYYYSVNNNTKFIHVRSHQKEPPKDSNNYTVWYGNKEADRLAVEAANS
tara:strand:+ start:1017 stop:1517 length:501 start_codon:yes stop_codon:yes gene_type:complete